MTENDYGSDSINPSTWTRERGESQANRLADEMLRAETRPAGDEGANQGDDRGGARGHEEQGQLVDGRRLVCWAANDGIHDEGTGNMVDEVQQQTVEGESLLGIRHKPEFAILESQHKSSRISMA